VRLSRPLDWLVIADHSDGMGLVGDSAAGKPQLLAYEREARWNKGLEEGGEAHPFLSPDDEFADYENSNIGNLDVSEAKTDAMLAGEYARAALKRGLAIETRLGTNPYKFGIIGATDSHTSLATAEEVTCASMRILSFAGA